mmetsp:Transcript_67417/g.188110  ORF Transcript_67417/g.188110 Transcript_67417/m.188110 type:complete len:419 (-) Transcript_67417:577-1833(-)
MVSSLASPKAAAEAIAPADDGKCPGHASPKPAATSFGTVPFPKCAPESIKSPILASRVSVTSRSSVGSTGAVRQFIPGTTGGFSSTSPRYLSRTLVHRETTQFIVSAPGSRPSFGSDAAIKSIVQGGNVRDFVHQGASSTKPSISASQGQVGMVAVPTPTSVRLPSAVMRSPTRQTVTYVQPLLSSRTLSRPLAVTLPQQQEQHRLMQRTVEAMRRAGMAIPPNSLGAMLPPSSDRWTQLEIDLFVMSEGAYDPQRMAQRRRVQGAQSTVGGTGVELQVRKRVSIVAPTMASRQHYHENLWRCFDAQNWPDKELVVIETYEDVPSEYLRKKSDGGQPHRACLHAKAPWQGFHGGPQAEHDTPHGKWRIHCEFRRRRFVRWMLRAHHRRRDGRERFDSGDTFGLVQLLFRAGCLYVFRP